MNKAVDKVDNIHPKIVNQLIEAIAQLEHCLSLK
jgi:hypothetical protein